jgi:hypothetical protein
MDWRDAPVISMGVSEQPFYVTRSGLPCGVCCRTVAANVTARWGDGVCLVRDTRPTSYSGMPLGCDAWLF